MEPKPPERKELLKSALVRIEQLERRLAAAEARSREAVAVIGVGCRFPAGANGPDAFWAILRDGVDAIAEIPPSRWNVDEFYDPDPDAPGRTYARGGGFVEAVDAFDPQFFGIAPREAPYMDPQQRLLLETVWATLEHAGIAPGSLLGSPTGVFLGMTTHDYARLLARGDGFEYVDTYFGTGVASSIAAGRIAYVLGLRGPAVTIDTACSSSLVAVHLACQSLRAAETRLALAAGVNLILSPEGHVVASKGRMLAPDSRCKTFDARADGYVRSEGCGVVALKRVSDAVADGDRILAVIRGTAMNQDGRSGGMTAPSGRAQEDVMRQACADAGVAPNEVAYVEAHGTGTSLGDPIEIHALGAVQGAGRPAGHPLLVGSVKTNIGHLEAAAGVAGVIKAVLALHHDEIPPHLHFETPNPYIAWDDVAIEVATARRPWPADRRRVVGVSSFGFSGTNTHVVLEAAPAPEPRPAFRERPAHLFVLSGRTPEALEMQVAHARARLDSCPPAELPDLCYTAAAGRTHFEHRLAVVGASADEIGRALEAYGRGERSPSVAHGEASLKRVPQVAFLFTGQGSQYVNMGRELYETQSTFREALQRADRALASRLDASLLDVLYPAAGREAVSDAWLGQTAWTQPALFAIEYALASLWQSWGVQPAAVMGHSVGEYVAAAVAGVLSVDDALALIAERARLMQALPTGGVMAAVGADEETVARALAPFARQVSIAAVNGPAQTVVSGSDAGVAAVLEALGPVGRAAQRLTVSHAFHSPLIEPMVADLERAAAAMPMQPPQVPLVSNLTGELVDEARPPEPGYWARHARAPVRFAASLGALRRAGCDVFLEIGPHPTLTTLGSRCLGAEDVRWLPSLRRGRSDWTTLLSSLASLFAAGAPVTWTAVDAGFPRRKADLPTYPFQRQRYWVDMPPPGATSKASTARGGAHPLLGRRLSSPKLADVVFEGELDGHSLAVLTDHRIFDQLILPAAAYLEMAEAAAALVDGGEPSSVEQVVIHEPLIVRAGEVQAVQTIVSSGPAEPRTVEIYSRERGDAAERAGWRLHAIGRLVRQPTASSVPVEADSTRGTGVRVDGADYYARLAAAGVAYGPSFRGLQRAERDDGWASGTLVVPDAVGRDGQGYRVHPGVLDACFQTIGLALPGGDTPDRGDQVYLPIEIGAYRRHAAIEKTLRVEARVAMDSGTGETLTGRVEAFDAAGALVLEVSGLRFKRASRAAVVRASAASVDDWLHEVEWRRLSPASGAPIRGGRWLLFADSSGTARALAGALAKDGAACTIVTPGDAYTWATSDEVRLRPGAPEDFVRLLDEVAKTGRPAGVIHCWNLDVADGSDPRPDLERARLLGTVSVLHLAQALAVHGHERVPLTIVTRQAQPAGTTAARGVAPLQAAVWGLGRVIVSEHPEIQTRLIDIDGGSQPAGLAALASEVASPDRSEPQVALRGGERLAPRLSRSRLAVEAPALRVPESPTFGLEIAQRGVLENLVLRPITRAALGPRDVSIRVEASGLNFRDVLNALGMYPGDPGHLGGEVVGVVDAVGPEVTRFAIGDPVLALTPRAFCSHVTTTEPLAWRRPDWLRVDAAATIPIVFQTSQYALVHLAKMRAGERVLIHAGAGGVGLAAIQIAQLAGAEIFSTAGSPQKRDLLRSLGVPHVMDSRTLAFADEIRDITRGEGIDIVLNALAGDFIPKSLSLLRQGGRFLELGKTDLWDDRRAKEVNPDASYAAVYLGDVCVSNPALIEQMHAELMPLFERRALRPLPFRSWPIDRSLEAFRYMAQAKHVGKIVIEQVAAANRPLVRSDSAYVVTGAYGGLGLAVAGWLADRGARHLTLVGRREPGDVARAAVQALEARGVSVETAIADVGDRQALERVFQALDARGLPVRGVVHAAGALDDGVVTEQRAERFERVMRPKIDGAWNLHVLTGGSDLDFFVLFAAGAGLFGAPGQANYAAANAYLDGLAWSRRAAGQPAVSIDWGPWSEAGMASRLGARERERWAAQGLSTIDTARGLVALERAITAGRPQVAVLPIDWERFLAQWPASGEPSLLRDLSREHQGRARAAESLVPTVSLREELASAPVEDRRAVLAQHVREQVAKVLQIPASSLRGDRGFAELGMDSLMSVELSNRLKRTTERSLPATLAFEHPTIDQLIDFLAELLDVKDAVPVASAAAEAAERNELLGEVERLSDEEAEASLMRELEGSGY